MTEIHLHVALTDAQFNLLMSNVVGEIRGQILEAPGLINRPMAVRLRNTLRAADLSEDDKLLEVIASPRRDYLLLRNKNFGRVSLREFYCVFADLISAANERKPAEQPPTSPGTPPAEASPAASVG